MGKRMAQIENGIVMNVLWCRTRRGKPIDGLTLQTGLLATAAAELPPGQLKKVLTEDIIAILAKYGVVIQ